MSRHTIKTGRDVHTQYFRTYTNASNRVADTPIEVGLPAVSAEDVALYKVALQIDDFSEWLLTNDNPVTWIQLNDVGGGGASLPYTSITDPAVNAAVSVVVIDANAGTIITLTAPGNTQTMVAPTDTTAGKLFTIVNNDTSTDSIQINGITVAPNTYLKTEWDGTAWIVLGAGAAATPGGSNNSIQRNSSGLFAGSANHTFDPATNTEQVLGDIVQQGGDAANQYTPTIESTTATGANPRDLSQQGDFLAVVDSNADDLRIFNLKAPGGPALVNLTPLVIGTLRGVDWPARFMVVTDTDSSGRLHVVDTLDKSDPQVVGTVIIGGSPRSVKVVGNIAYVVGNIVAQGLVTVDISNPEIPKVLDTFVTPSGPRVFFDVADEIVYMVTNATGNNFLALDVSDPKNITQVSAVDVGTAIEVVQVQPPFAFIIDSATRRLDVYDISDPNAITNTKIGTLLLEAAIGGPRNLILAEDFAYITDVTNDDLKVVNISDLSSMFIVGAVDVGANSTSLSGAGTAIIVLDNTEDVFRIVDVGGVKAQNIRTGNLSAANALIKKNLSVAGAVSAAGMSVGASGINSAGEISAGGRFLGGAPDNVVEIYKELDFNDVRTGTSISAGHILLQPGITYEIMRPLTLTNQLTIPVTVSGFDPAVILSRAKFQNIISVNLSVPFIDSISAAGQLTFVDCRIKSIGTGTFANMSGSTQNAATLQLTHTDIVDFADGSTFDTMGILFNNRTFWSDSGTPVFSDCDTQVTEFFTLNTVDNGDSAFEIKSLSASVQPSFLSVSNSKLSSQANEAFFMLHSNLIAGSTVSLNGIETSPFSPGTGDFFATLSGAITALADSGGAPGTRTVVVSAGHKVADGDIVVHTGFTSAPALNGTFVASNVTATQYEVVAVFTVTDTGTWTNASLDHTDVLVMAFDNPGQSESKTIGTMFVAGNTDVTVITTVNTFTDLDLGTALEASNIQRWSLTNPTTGEMTYNGIEPFNGTLTASISLESFGGGGGEEFHFRAVKNGLVLIDPVEAAVETSSNAASIPFVVPISVVNGDTIRLQVENVEGIENIVITHISVSIQ